MTKQEAFQQFEDADFAWNVELVRLFGRDAGNARFEKRGRGEPGSKLAELYAAKISAQRAWQVASGLPATAA